MKLKVYTPYSMTPWIINLLHRQTVIGKKQTVHTKRNQDNSDTFTRRVFTPEKSFLAIEGANTIALNVFIARSPANQHLMMILTYRSETYVGMSNIKGTCVTCKDDASIPLTIKSAKEGTVAQQQFCTCTRASGSTDDLVALIGMIQYTLYIDMYM